MFRIKIRINIYYKIMKMMRNLKIDYNKIKIIIYSIMIIYLLIDIYKHKY